MHVGPDDKFRQNIFGHPKTKNNAERGLVLLAAATSCVCEVYVKMNREGIPCRLVTGEERREPEVDGEPIPIPNSPAGVPHDTSFWHRL